MNVKTLETFTPLSCSLKVLDRISKVYAYIKEDHINSLCKTLTRAGKDTSNVLINTIISSSLQKKSSKPESSQ